MTRPDSYTGIKDCFTCKHCVFREAPVGLRNKTELVGYCNIGNDCDPENDAWLASNRILKHRFCDDYLHTLKEHYPRIATPGDHEHHDRRMRELEADMEADNERRDLCHAPPSDSAFRVAYWVVGFGILLMVWSLTMLSCSTSP